jgi:hypothetical protein
MADRTRPGYCAPHFIRDGRKNVPADTIYEGTSMCWDCLRRLAAEGLRAEVERPRMKPHAGLPTVQCGMSHRHLPHNWLHASVGGVDYPASCPGNR